MSTKSSNFNKKILSILIDKARGERSVRKFAQDCNISYLQMRKLLLCEQENPPRMALITKLAENSEGRVELEDYLHAIGAFEDNNETLDEITPKEKMLLSNYNNLSSKQQKTVDDFIAFLLKY